MEKNTPDRTCRDTCRWHVFDIKRKRTVYLTDKPKYTSKYWNAARYVIWDNLNMKEV